MQLIIDYARAEGLQTIEGQVLRENTTMLAMCRKLGFEIAPDPHDADLLSSGSRWPISTYTPPSLSSQGTRLPPRPTEIQRVSASRDLATNGRKWGCCLNQGRSPAQPSRPHTCPACFTMR